MVDLTDNHEFQLWADNEEQWEHRSDFETLEQKVWVRDEDAALNNYEPHDGSLFLATDTEDVYLGDGNSWTLKWNLGDIGSGEGGGGDVQNADIEPASVSQYDTKAPIEGPTVEAFEAGDLSYYSGDTGPFSIVASDIEGANMLRFDSPTAGSLDSFHFTSDVSETRRGFTYSAYVRGSTGSGSNGQYGIAVLVDFDSTGITHGFVFRANIGADQIEFLQYDNGFVSGGGVSASVTLSDNTLYRLEVDADPGSTRLIGRIFDWDDNLLQTLVLSNPGFSGASGGFGWYARCDASDAWAEYDFLTKQPLSATPARASGTGGGGGGSSGTQLNILDFGADPSGGTNSNEALKQAVSEANPGDTIVFPDGTYLIDLETENIEIGKSIRLLGDGAKLDFVATDQQGSEWIRFSGDGMTGNSASLSTSVAKGSTAFPTTDASAISPGDWVVIHNATDRGGNKTLVHQPDGQQISRVDTVDTNTVHLAETAVWDYQSGAEIEVVDLLDRPIVEGFDADWSQGGKIHMQWCNRPTFKDLTGTNDTWPPYRCLDCRNARYIRIEHNRAGDRGSSNGEPLRINRTNGALVDHPHVSYVRRAIDMQWSTQGVEIRNPKLFNNRIGITAHSSHVDDVTVIGGEIISHTGTDGSAAGPNAVSWRDEANAASNWTFIGTRIEAPDTGVKMGDGFELIGCDVYGGGEAVSIHRGTASITGGTIRIDDAQGFDNYAILIDNDAGYELHDIDIDTYIVADGVRRPIRILTDEAVTRASFDCDVLMKSAASYDVYDINTASDALLSDLTISGHVSAVSGEEDITDFRIRAGAYENVKIQDYHSELTHAGIRFWETTGWDIFKVQNCTVQHASLGDFDTSTGDYVWVTDNRIRGSLTMPGATNEVNRDNFVG